jgi:Outer membrane protein beta-barrel domain
MKRITLLMAVACFALTTQAQQDTDTLQSGNFVIVKKDKKAFEISSGTGDLLDVSFTNNKKKKNKNLSTNWWILDLGFANWRDETNYASAEAMNFLRPAPGKPAFTADDLKLNTGKSSNVNIWFFMQKLNVAKKVLNLKYGLGVEMYNYRYSTNISYNKTPTYVFRDSISFSKNKLFAKYLTVPFMININPTPGSKKGFSMSAGVSAGYLIGSRTKQISGERGKDKSSNDYGLNKWRLAAIGELGLGPVRLYGSYSFNALHEKGTIQYPYAVGIRFSNW